MSDLYSFTGGNYDPVSQIDVMPEQEACLLYTSPSPRD